jgi:hypothetical protein
MMMRPMTWSKSPASSHFQHDNFLRFDIEDEKKNWERLIGWDADNAAMIFLEMVHET